MKIFLAFVASFAVSVSFVASVQAQEQLGDVVSTATGVGDLQVSIESAPLLGSTPRGATRVEMATLNVSASCDADVTISSITLSHVGLGETSDIAAVYLVEGYRRASRSRTFERKSRTAELRVTALTVKKCSAVRVQVLADISKDATVASEHGVTIVGAAAITSTAKTTTFLPSDVTGRTFTTSPQTAGAITVHFLPVKGPLRFGRRETVARVQLSADMKNDHLLQAITFKNLGDARDMNLLDFTLETRSGEVLTPKAQRMRGLYVTLEFDPTYVLDRSKTVVLLLKAQINAGQSKKVNFTIEEPADLKSVLYRPSR